MDTGRYTPEEFGMRKVSDSEYVDARGQRYLFRCPDHHINFFQPEDVIGAIDDVDEATNG